MTEQFLTDTLTRLVRYRRLLERLVAAPRDTSSYSWNMGKHFNPRMSQGECYDEMVKLDQQIEAFRPLLPTKSYEKILLQAN